MIKKWKKVLLLPIFALTVLLCSCAQDNNGAAKYNVANAESLDEVPEYEGAPYVAINGNEPKFSDSERQKTSYEEYSSLDGLGRCQVAKANIGEDLMPTEKRESIFEVKPSGWKNKKYDNVDGGYLYNRCHLIGFQLTAENANEKNLITGTRYMNTEGMLPFENMVADYIKETGNHVLYRVTPVYEGDNLVASGVQMEAESVEDKGESISFNVYVYNVQPGVEIDYKTGDNWPAEDEKRDTVDETDYILNTSTKKFHKPFCPGIRDMKEKNKKSFTGKRESLIKDGYSPCGMCRP